MVSLSLSNELELVLNLGGLVTHGGIETKSGKSSSSFGDVYKKKKKKNLHFYKRSAHLKYNQKINSLVSNLQASVNATSLAAWAE